MKPPVAAQARRSPSRVTKAFYPDRLGLACRSCRQLRHVDDLSPPTPGILPVGLQAWTKRSVSGESEGCPE